MKSMQLLKKISSKVKYKRAISMDLKNIFWIILVFILSASACSDDCEMDHVKFVKLNRTPFIVDSDHLNHNNCEVPLSIDLPGYFTLDDCRMRIIDSGYEVTLPEGSKFLLFNFETNVGEKNVVSVEEIDIAITLEEIFYSDNENVFKFRLNKSVIFDEIIFDVVCFVTKERFIVGTYVSNYTTQGVEQVIAEDGDIFRSVIDYSSKEFRKLH